MGFENFKELAGNPPAAGGAVPTTYFNGFVVAASNADVSIDLMLGGQVVHRLFCSYSIATTLKNSFNDLTDKVEGATGQKFLTVKDLEDAIKKIESKSNAPKHE